MKRRIYTCEELSKSFRISENGELERLFKSLGWRIVECKANHCRGYCDVRFKGSNILYHTIVFILHHGTIEDTEAVIDHLSGNKLDNRIENLRLVSNRENALNSHKHRTGRLTGCYFYKRDNKWQAQIRINGKQIGLGSYNTEPEAHQIYSEALTMLNKSVEEIQAYFGIAQFSSNYKGVSYEKQSNKWKAQIQINGKKIHLGLFKTEPEAHQTYLKAVELMEQYIDNDQFRVLLSKSISSSSL